MTHSDLYRHVSLQSWTILQNFKISLMVSVKGSWTAHEQLITLTQWSHLIKKIMLTTHLNIVVFKYLLHPLKKSLLILVIWLVLIGAIYSRNTPIFAPNRIFFPSQRGSFTEIQQPNACFKKPIKLQENETQLLKLSTNHLLLDQQIRDFKLNQNYNKILERDWLSPALFEL